MAGPKPSKLEEQAQEVADAIRDVLPEGIGFGLILFDFGEDGQLTWISNGRREDIRKALIEWLEWSEGMWVGLPQHGPKGRPRWRN